MSYPNRQFWFHRTFISYDRWRSYTWRKNTSVPFQLFIWGREDDENEKFFGLKNIITKVMHNLIIRETSTITHTKFTNTKSCSPYFKTYLLYKCTKIFHPLHSGFIPTLAKLYAKMYITFSISKILVILKQIFS